MALYSVKPLAFRDGKCDVWSVEKRTLKEKLGTFDFKEDTLGIKTFYELNTLGIEVEKTISIPYNNLINNSHVIVMNGEQYSISVIQKKDTFPKSLKITLAKSPYKWKEVSNDNL